ncbi:hypothetical protein CHARACLAT_018729 [Characodon lateralis]|uniref:Uncharacterized protein n=1 Tax=Characodon lateralis TaxID=208331 RepID=A0ABU7EBF4_9TELE|nr:hypothetical protein [Characodon lateralis]
MTLPVKRGMEREDQEPRVGLTSKMLTADGGGLGSHSHFSTSPHPKRHGEAFINSSLPFTCSFCHCLSYLPSQKLSCFCQNEKPSFSQLCSYRQWWFLHEGFPGQAPPSAACPTPPPDHLYKKSL